MVFLYIFFGFLSKFSKEENFGNQEAQSKCQKKGQIGDFAM
jgi:hypothetical protein